MPKLIDAHTHVQVSQFKKDREEVILRALNQGIWAVNVGDDLKTSKDAVELAEKYPEGVYAAVGQHPARYEIFDYDFYKKLAQNKKVLAIGECGLDYFRDKRQETRDKQKDLFLKQIELSKEVGKPLMIHCREAFPDLIKILEENYPGSSVFDLNRSAAVGVVHFFAGTIGDAEKLLEMGFYFTFGGLITFNRSFDEIVKFISLEKILIETDAPFVAPAPYRGKRNEPAYVVEVAKKLAELKEMPFDEIAKITVENTKRVFNLL